MEILSSRPHLQLVSGGVLSREERAILELTPAAVSILSRSPDGVSVVSSNERYERIFSGAQPPPELVEQALICFQTGTEVAFEAACETSAAIRYVRFRMQPKDGRIVCVAEDITTAYETAREVTRQRAVRRSDKPIDPLTGAMGRRRFMTDARQELVRATRHQIPLALVIIDLDRFQELNEAQGCESGDDALRAVAEVLRFGLRDTDFIARIGGDEFALLLLHTDGQYGRIVTDRLRETVTIRSAMFDNAEVPLTISAGVSQYQPGESLEELFFRAENALYTAKGSGRDRVVLS